MRSASAIAFDYAPSRHLRHAIHVATALALIALAASALPWWTKAALAPAAILYALRALATLRRDAGCRLRWHEAGHWLIAREGRAEQSVELRGATVRGEWIVLRLGRARDRGVALVLAPDNSAADVRRRLRVRLGGADAATR